MEGGKDDVSPRLRNADCIEDDNGDKAVREPDPRAELTTSVADAQIWRVTAVKQLIMSGLYNVYLGVIPVFVADLYGSESDQVDAELG